MSAWEYEVPQYWDFSQTEDYTDRYGCRQPSVHSRLLFVYAHISILLHGFLLCASRHDAWFYAQHP